MSPPIHGAPSRSRPPMRRTDARRLCPSVEPMEGRLVLSHVTLPPGMVSQAINLSDGSGAGAILAALRGGAGSEFVTLLKRGVPNLSGVLRQFVSGTRTEVDVKGFAAKV